MHDLRLLPRRFLVAYRWSFGCDPPAEFLSAYEILAESLYWGSGAGEMNEPISRKGRSAGDWFFADPRLLPAKIRVDKVLAASAAALLRTAFEGEGPSGPAASRAKRADMARARESGHRASGEVR